LIVVQSALILLAFYVAHLVLSWAAPGLGLDGVWDIAGLPLLALTIGGLALVLMPLVNVFGRRLEGDADEYSLRATDNPDAFASMLTRLMDQNLAESRPSRWVELLLHDHPPLHRRLETAQRYRAIKEPK
jgi:STE24 endopeptidase